MLKMIGATFLVLLGIDAIYGWALDYPSLNWIYPEEGNQFNAIHFDIVVWQYLCLLIYVSDVSFRLYSTRHPDARRDILFDERPWKYEASLEYLNEGFFNSSIPTKIVAHGNGGGIKLGKVLWDYYTEAAAKNGKHYNVIEILWGSGNLKRHVWTGIKTARVVNSFIMKYGLMR